METTNQAFEPRYAEIRKEMSNEPTHQLKMMNVADVNVSVGLGKPKESVIKGEKIKDKPAAQVLLNNVNSPTRDQQVLFDRAGNSQDWGPQLEQQIALKALIADTTKQPMGLINLANHTPLQDSLETSTPQP